MVWRSSKNTFQKLKRYSHIYAHFIFSSKYAKPCARASPLAQPLAPWPSLFGTDWHKRPELQPARICLAQELWVMTQKSVLGALLSGVKPRAGRWQVQGTQRCWGCAVPWPARSWHRAAHSLAPIPPHLWVYEIKQNLLSTAKAAKVEGENLALGRPFGQFLLSKLAPTHQTLALLWSIRRTLV